MDNERSIFCTKILPIIFSYPKNIRYNPYNPKQKLIKDTYNHRSRACARDIYKPGFRFSKKAFSRSFDPGRP